MATKIFRLTNTKPAPRYGRGRIAVVRAFMARPTWDRRAAAKAHNLVYRHYWYSRDNYRDEWEEILGPARDALDEWERIREVAPEGSLRLALVRPSRAERARRTLGKIQRHKEWLIERIKKQIGYKEFKTADVRRKWWRKLDAATRADPWAARLMRWEKRLLEISR